MELKDKIIIIATTIVAAAIIIVSSIILLGKDKKMDIPGNIEASTVAKVEFSAESGIYESEFELTMSLPEGYDYIAYTLDGSDPVNSKTVFTYSEPVMITDRKDAANVVSAVEPVLYCGNFNRVNKTKDGFDCDLEAPSDDAVDKCTSVRAVAKKKDGTASVESNAVYFIGTMEDHIAGIADSVNAYGMDLAVVSISIDYESLFNYNTGIYVKGATFDENVKNWGKLGYDDGRNIDGNYDNKGRDWEREAGITIIEVAADGTTKEVISQNCGVRIQGNYSRNDLQKGLRLYARTEYGNKNFKYPLFGEDYVNDAGEVMDKFDTFILRAGGNTAFSAKFNDTYWQSMIKDLAVETKESRPAILYINGEYFGLYVMEEDYSDDYFEDLHGVDKDNVVVYKGDAEAYESGYKLDEGSLPEGETNEYYYMNELAKIYKKYTTLENDADYEEFIKYVDPESFIDYIAVESWIDNKWDWPGKNWSLWAVIPPEGEEVDTSNEYNDGRWRLMVYDVEFGGFGGKDDARTNTIKVDNYKPHGLIDQDTSNPVVRCFALMMTNAGFREKFYERLNSLTDNYYSETNALAMLDRFEGAYSPLYEQFFNRYPGAGKVADAEGSIANIRSFVENRADHVQKMIDYCERILA
ncbi:MAG: CotH kinase family protein [Lachnospiraceae bacterium]|nr:CotH kinase family protein [Lachnospiraceae bacterium]